MATLLEENEDELDEVPLSRRTRSMGSMKKRRRVNDDLEDTRGATQEEPVNLYALGDDEFDIKDFKGLHGF